MIDIEKQLKEIDSADFSAAIEEAENVANILGDCLEDAVEIPEITLARKLMSDYKEKMKEVDNGLLRIISIGHFLKKVESYYPRPSQDEEKAIVLLAQTGNEEACWILFGIFLPMVYEIALKFTSKHDGNFCEVFEEYSAIGLDKLLELIFKGIASFQWNSLPRTFIFAGLKNGIIENFRDELDKKKAMNYLLEVTLPFTKPVNTELAENEPIERFIFMPKSGSKRDKTILKRRFVDGWTFKAIAKEFGLTPDGARSVVRRGKVKVLIE